MIRRQVSAALLVRDAFTGQPFSSPGRTFCSVDGQACTPLWKEGGYLVLTDLPPGEHTIVLRRRGYREETLRVPVADGKTWEGWTGLHPGPGYVFPARTARGHLTLSGRDAAGAEVWLAQDGGGRLKLAQDRAKAGDMELKLFYSGPESRLPVPGDFLIADRRAPETVSLESLLDGKARLARPLARDHVRGKELMFAQRYEAGEDGRLDCVLREGGKLWALCAGKLSVLEAQPGENDWELSGPGG